MDIHNLLVTLFKSNYANEFSNLERFSRFFFSPPPTMSNENQKETFAWVKQFEEHLEICVLVWERTSIRKCTGGLLGRWRAFRIIIEWKKTSSGSLGTSVVWEIRAILNSSIFSAQIHTHILFVWRKTSILALQRKVREEKQLKHSLCLAFKVKFISASSACCETFAICEEWHKLATLLGEGQVRFTHTKLPHTQPPVERTFVNVLSFGKWTVDCICLQDLRLPISLLVVWYKGCWWIEEVYPTSTCSRLSNKTPLVKLVKARDNTNQISLKDFYR